jgi:glutathione synthase/RimK-type ligase-like ATP-grasp enzyme
MLLPYGRAEVRHRLRYAPPNDIETHGPQIMPRRILILSFENDLHALAIQAQLKRHDAEADIVDTSKFPTALSLRQTGPDFSDIILGSRRLSDYQAVWNRRAKRPLPSPEISREDEGRFAARECYEALWGALYASGLPIYNRPEYELAANHKPYQLRLAQALGLNIPSTLITTSAEEALEFYRRHQRVIYKTFTGATWRMMDTRPLAESDLEDLWRLQYAPVIFQEYLELGREYRVSLVEEECHAGEITLSNLKATYDWRIDDNHGVTPTELPPEIRERLRRLLQTLHLHSGAVDLRETPDGKIYFLEINPTGQFLFLDIYGGMSVASAFCEMLLQPTPTREHTRPLSAPVLHKEAPAKSTSS